MIRLATLFGILALAGCASTPVPVTPDPVRLPPLPASLAQRPEPLPPITATDTHGLIRDGIQTDRAYGDLRHQLIAVQEFYFCVREAINLQTDPAACFNSRKDQ